MTSKLSFRSKLFRVLILVVSIGVGVGIIRVNLANKQPPERLVAVEMARSVKVIEVANLPFIIEATGFGIAQPDQIWSAVSNVKGNVVFRHENLESGEVLQKGTLLLEIDAGIYQLALTEAEAEIATVEAEITQLKQEAVNVQALLALEQQRLDLFQIDLVRTQTLFASGTVSRTTLDAQTRATLQQRQAVQSLINQQSIIPTQLARLDAQKARAFSIRARVLNDLDDTKFYAPFDIRINDVNIETFQYVNPGQVLLSGDGILASEIVLQVPMQDLRRVLGELPNDGGKLTISQIDAHVELVGENQIWDAEVIRIANGIDPATRTVRVVLSVQQPKGLENMLDNPPLPKGMFVEGVLRIGSTGQLVVPQQAIHEGWVYLVDADSRLERREVEIAFRQNGMAIIQSGLQAGEMIILDDIVPAVSGALLDPRRDADTEQMIRANAAGAIR